MANAIAAVVTVQEVAGVEQTLPATVRVLGSGSDQTVTIVDRAVLVSIPPGEAAFEPQPVGSLTAAGLKTTLSAGKYSFTFHYS